MFALKKLTATLLLTIVSSNLNATDNNLSDFDKWQQQRTQQFAQFVTKQDQDFNQFLKQRWLVKKVESAPKRDLVPKIVRPPSVSPNLAEPDTSEPIQVIEPKPVTPIVTAPPKHIVEPEIVDVPVEPKKPELNSNQVNFLGNNLNLDKVSLPNLELSYVDQDAIAASWQKMANNKSVQLLQQLNEFANKLNLDDWGKAYLAYRVITETSPKLSTNEVNLYTWYYLLQQGFDSRIGYGSEQVHLLLKVTQPLYAQKFFRIGNSKYYFVNFSSSPTELGLKIKTYQTQHALASSDVKIDMSKIPALSGETLTRELEFKYLGKQHTIAVPYNKAYVEFLNLYPQLELEHYFQTGLPFDSKQVLLSYLAQEIAGKTEKQALNFLLRFVQYAFAYKTDDQQFNQENFLVATETIHYPYADCEDRSVLLAYLIENLLGNKMIGVLYKGHVAIAVKTKSEIDGAGYRVKGDKFLVADPTYIGAGLGQVMTGYEKESPKLVVIN